MSSCPPAPASPVLTTGIIDVYHGDADAIRSHGRTLTQALVAAKSDPKPVVCVIAKCAQGKDYVDPAWQAWADATRAAGLEFSSYFFPSNTATGTVDCDWFLRNLEVAGFDPKQHLAWLDKERNPDPGGTVTLPNVVAFIEDYKTKTGRLPGYYSNTSDLANDSRSTDPVLLAALQAAGFGSMLAYLSRLPLWAAAYGNFVPNGPKTPWPWSLWQYMGAESGPGEWPSDPVMYPRSAAGVGHVDRSVYRGTVDQLHEFLLTAGKLPEPPDAKLPAASDAPK